MRGITRFQLSAAAWWLAMPAAVGLILFTCAGRLDLPFVWAVLGVLAGFGVAMAFWADPAMLRERRRPGGASRDSVGQRIGALLLLAHWVLAGLDVGRYGWTHVPYGVQIAGLVVYVAANGALLWAMTANPFYSSAVRVQEERGHYAVAAGPYRLVRHPGYAATLVAVVSGGLALGSWVAMLPVVAFAALFVRRTLVEDRLLHAELTGYADYGRRVRYRLVPGIF